MNPKHKKTFEFQGLTRIPSICDVWVYGDMVVVGENPNNTGTSVTNAWPDLAQQICNRFGLDPLAIKRWVEYYPKTKDKPERTFDEVKLAMSGAAFVFAEPKWRRISNHEMTGYVMQVVAKGNYFFENGMLHTVELERMPHGSWHYKVMLLGNQVRSGICPEEWSEEAVLKWAEQQGSGKGRMFAEKFFPELHGTWGEINLAKVARSMTSIFSLDGNPFVNATVVGRLERFLAEQSGCDFLWGGFMEDRTDLWSGIYPEGTELIHLGIDLGGMEVGTQVALPVAAKLMYSGHDPDQNGGWGQKLIFEYENNNERRYLVLGHLKEGFGLKEIGVTHAAGTVVGRIAEKECNGGWWPHLHVQCMREFDFGCDGYSGRYHGIENDFFDPWQEFK